MLALIDCDILAYEAAFAGQYKDEDTGEIVPRDFDDVIEVFEHKLSEINEAVWGTEEPLLFLTGDERLLRLENRKRKRLGEELLPWRANFRFEKATTTPYKERKSKKPYHFHNLRAYIFTQRSPLIAWGMEADDALSVYQTSRIESLDTIICSRDKDLRMVPGMHYGWECGNQPGYPPTLVSELGKLEINEKGALKGEGLKFFYAQLIMGDSVDTIPGLPRGGPSMAYKLLHDCTTEEEMYEKVSEKYREKLGDGFEDYLQEQCNLLWMVRHLDEDGGPVLFVRPDDREVPGV